MACRVFCRPLNYPRELESLCGINREAVSGPVAPRGPVRITRVRRASSDNGEPKRCPWQTPALGRHRMRGMVCRPRLRMESDGHWCPLHRRQPKPPLPQGFGVIAALERDDRPTICERAPRRLPVGKRNRRAGAKQTSDDALHTFAHRARAICVGERNPCGHGRVSATPPAHVPTLHEGLTQAAAHPAAGTESLPHRNLSARPF